MKNSTTNLVLSAIFSLALFSCTKESTTPMVTVTSNLVKDIPADTVLGLSPTTGMPISFGKYTFYSLERNMVVPNSDSATTNWDIALVSNKILINGGTSGKGLGGAFVFVGLFDNLKTIPADSVFKVDNGPSAYAITFGSGKGWYTYDQITSLITPLAGRVLVIKTASGKFAKVEIINYYKGGVTLPTTASDMDKLTKQRYYTFRYSYQSNGTKTF